MARRYRGSIESAPAREARARAGPCRAFSSCALVAGHDDHRVLAVELLDEDVDAIGGRDFDLLPDDVRMDGKLAAATIDEHRQRDPRRPPKIRQLVERRADGAAGIEHVVDDHDLFPLEIPGKTGWADA